MLTVKPYSECCITCCAVGFNRISPPSIRSRTETPSQLVSNLLQRVTQWMSMRKLRRGRARNSSPLLLDFPPDSEIPGRRVEARHRTVVQDGELLCQGLPGRKPPFLADPALFFPPLEDIVQHGSLTQA